MPRPTRSGALDHVVVVMFENRSFDNLLGRLYEPGEVPSFEGVLGKDLSNPIPEWAEHGADKQFVPYGVAPNMNTRGPIPARSCRTLTPSCSGPSTRPTVACCNRSRLSTLRTTRPSGRLWTGFSPTTSARSRPSSAGSRPMRSTRST